MLGRDAKLLERISQFAQRGLGKLRVALVPAFLVLRPGSSARGRDFDSWHCPDFSRGSTSDESIPPALPKVKSFWVPFPNSGTPAACLVLMLKQTQDTREALGGDNGIKVLETIRIDRPVESLYRFWRNLTDLPRFMTHLERVDELGEQRSHWVAKGPAGSRVEWDAEIINEVPNQVIGWQSLPGSDVVTAGSVNFDAAADGRATDVTVHLQYAPPAGRLGKIVAQLFGTEPAQAIREDLRRLKTMLETGATVP
jgi:uncharacterized membrane protein